MTWGLLAFFLVLKHFVISFVLDIGYSWSRHTKRRQWKCGLLIHSLVEISATLAIYLHYSLPSVVCVLIMEAWVLYRMCHIERNAQTPHSYREHLICELDLLMFYLFSSFLITSIDHLL